MEAGPGRAALRLAPGVLAALAAPAVLVNAIGRRRPTASYGDLLDPHRSP